MAVIDNSGAGPTAATPVDDRVELKGESLQQCALNGKFNLPKGTGQPTLEYSHGVLPSSGNVVLQASDTDRKPEEACHGSHLGSPSSPGLVFFPPPCPLRTLLKRSGPPEE